MAGRSYDQDSISYCSLSAETISSRRRRNHGCSLRGHSSQVDKVATKLRLGLTMSSELKGSIGNLSTDTTDTYGGAYGGTSNKPQPGELQHPKPPARRWNESFHNYRFVVVMFGGLSFGTIMLLRYNITVAILSMVNQTAIYMEENPHKTMDDFLAEGYSPGGEFDWDNEIQQLVMSLYMIAYTLPQVPATSVGLKLGCRWATPLSLTLCALANLLTPWAAHLGWRWVVGLRMLNGVGASAVLPMLLSLVENWMPYDEISLGLTCAQILQALLTTLNPLIAGYLSAIHWSYAFTVPGLATLAFCLLWPIVVTDKPDENRFISQQELDLICGCHLHDTCAIKDGADNMAEEEEENNKAVAWWRVFSVPSFYAYLLLWCCYCSSYSCFVFVLPTYLRQFLKISVANNGLYCALIQSGCILSVIWPHPMLRLLQGPFKLSLTAARRITHLVVCLVVAGTWCSVGAFHQSQLLLLFLNRATQGSNDIVVTSNIMSNYGKAGLSSLVFSMVNTVGNLSVVGSSSLVGYILDEEGASTLCWSWIFIGLGLSQLVMWLVFATVIRSEPIEFKELASSSSAKDKKLDLEAQGGSVHLEKPEKSSSTNNKQ